MTEASMNFKQALQKARHCYITVVTARKKQSVLCLPVEKFTFERLVEQGWDADEAGNSRGPDDRRKPSEARNEARRIAHWEFNEDDGWLIVHFANPAQWVAFMNRYERDQS